MFINANLEALFGRDRLMLAAGAVMRQRRDSPTPVPSGRTPAAPLARTRTRTTAPDKTPLAVAAVRPAAHSKPAEAAPRPQRAAPAPQAQRQPQSSAQQQESEEQQLYAKFYGKDDNQAQLSAEDKELYNKFYGEAEETPLSGEEQQLYAKFYPNGPAGQ